MAATGPWPETQGHLPSVVISAHGASLGFEFCVVGTKLTMVRGREFLGTRGLVGIMEKEESYELLGAHLSNGRQGRIRRRHDLRDISSLRA